VSSTDFAAFRLSEPTAADTTASIREARPAAR
jgi:hypothetical protein